MIELSTASTYVEKLLVKQSSQSEIIPQNVLSEIYHGIPGEALTQLRAARERCAEQHVQRLLKGGLVVSPSELPALRASILRSVPSILSPSLWLTESCGMPSGTPALMTADSYVVTEVVTITV